jgi:hypothetical protein
MNYDCSNDTAFSKRFPGPRPPALLPDSLWNKGSSMSRIKTPKIWGFSHLPEESLTGSFWGVGYSATRLENPTHNITIVLPIMQKSG